MSAATNQRNRFFAAMKAIDVGAKLARRHRVWSVVMQTPRDASVDLTLRSGRRSMVVSIPVCMTGPCLADVGLKPVTPAPEQRGFGWELA